MVIQLNKFKVITHGLVVKKMVIYLNKVWPSLCLVSLLAIRESENGCLCVAGGEIG